MAFGDSKAIQLVIEVNSADGEARVKSFNNSLRDMSGAGERAGRGIDGLAGSIAKGALAALGIHSVLTRVSDALKALTVDSALYAARAETLAVVVDSLARVNGLNARATRAAVEGIRSQGIAINEAREGAARLIGAQLDLAKAAQLARVAQDAAVIAGINSSEAFEGIVNGIVRQEIRILRTYGIQVDFQKAFQEEQKRTGQALTETQKKNVALNEVLKFGANLLGTYEAAMGTAGKQMTSLKRLFDEAKASIGEGFLPQVKAAVTALTGLATWAKENGTLISDSIKLIATAAVGATAAFVAMRIAALGAASAFVLTAGGATTVLLALAPLAILATYSKNVSELTQNLALLATVAAGLALRMPGAIAGLGALGAAGLAWVATPGGWITLVILGLTAIVALLDHMIRKKERFEDAQLQLAKDLFRASGDNPQLAIEQARQAGIDEATILHARAANDREFIQDKLARRIAAAQAELQINKELQEAILKSQQEGLLKSLDALRDAGLAFLSPLQKIFAEDAKLREDLRRVEVNGQITQRKLLNAELAALDEALHLKIRALMDEDHAKALKLIQEDIAAARERVSAIIAIETELFERRVQMAQDLDVQLVNQARQLQLEQLDIARDTALRRLEMESLNQPQTLAAKLALEQSKADIEVEYLRRTYAVKVQIADLEMALDRIKMESALMAARVPFEEAQAQLAKLDALHDLVRTGAAAQNQAAIDAAQENAAIRQARIVLDHYREVFDSVKSQAGEVFDALLEKSGKTWTSIGDLFKTTILTAIKDTFTTAIAQLLTPFLAQVRAAITGQGGGFGGGSLGTVGTVAAALPAIGGIGGGGLPGAAGATPPFIPQGGGGGSLLGGFAGSLAGLKDFLGISGSIQTGPGQATTFGAASLIQKLGAIAKSDAAMLGGIALALDGIRRGGKLGLAQTTGGGALLGFKFGGPLGAAIGAGIGFGVGLFGLGRKSPEDKMKEAIRKMYAVEIKDKEILRHLVEMAKPYPTFDYAISQPQLRDVIRAYGEQMGVRANMPDLPRATFFAQSGGSIYQVPASGPSSASFANLDRLNLGSGGSKTAEAISVPITLELDGQVLDSRTLRVVSKNGRVVSETVVKGWNASAGLREGKAMQWNPGEVTE